MCFGLILIEVRRMNEPLHRSPKKMVRALVCKDHPHFSTDRRIPRRNSTLLIVARVTTKLTGFPGQAGDPAPAPGTDKAPADLADFVRHVARLTMTAAVTDGIFIAYFGTTKAEDTTMIAKDRECAS